MVDVEASADESADLKAVMLAVPLQQVLNFVFCIALLSFFTSMLPYSSTAFLILRNGTARAVRIRSPYSPYHNKRTLLSQDHTLGEALPKVYPL